MVETLASSANDTKASTFVMAEKEIIMIIRQRVEVVVVVDMIISNISTYQVRG